MNHPIIIIGAGGHARVIADALLAAGEKVLGYTDSDRSLQGTAIYGLPVLGDDSRLCDYSPVEVLLANGMGGVGERGKSTLRSRVQIRLAAQGWRFAAVRHPTAIVSAFASLAEGVQLLAASVVQAGASVGVGAIVNTAAVIEHDVSLGDWVHVAPGAVLCGNVSIEKFSHIGAGAVVRQGIRLGADTVVAAGAVVVKDFSGPGLLMGVPARFFVDK